MYFLQNVSVVFSACTALVMIAIPPNAPDWMPVLLAMCFIAGAGAADLGGLGSTLAVEREWVKLMAEGDSACLARMNAGVIMMMRGLYMYWLYWSYWFVHTCCCVLCMCCVCYGWVGGGQQVSMHRKNAQHLVNPSQSCTPHTWWIPHTTH